MSPEQLKTNMGNVFRRSFKSNKIVKLYIYVCAVVSRPLFPHGDSATTILYTICVLCRVDKLEHNILHLSTQITQYTDLLTYIV